MREYKFRAKGIRENKDKWFVGSLFVEDGMGITYIVSGVNTHYETNYLQVEVDSQTVGQFTGLKDAKGKEIYEGDILLYRLPENMIALNNSDKSVVFYGHGMFLVSHGKIEFSVNQVLGVHGDDAVVIGNVHDNPELLKEGD